MDADHYVWGSPSRNVRIHFRRAVMEGIQREALEGFTAIPDRQLEIGGVLLGRINGAEQVVFIDDFEPVPCGHGIDSAYHLTAKDEENLIETLEWFRAGGSAGLSVLGLYRSHTRYGFFLSEEDQKLIWKHFPEPSNVFLVIKPVQPYASVADFYFYQGDRLQEAGKPEPFPFGEIAPAAPLAPEREPELEPAAEESEAEPQPELAPALAAEFPERKRPQKFLPTLAFVLAVAGGMLGYQSFRMKSVGEADRVVPATQTPARHVEAEVRVLLSQWSDAVLRGDRDAFMNCYASVLNVYLDKRNVGRAEVRRNLDGVLSRYGRFDLLRLSDLRITPAGPSHAVATFRKYWKTAGPKEFAGAEQDRLTFVRTSAGWKIAAEQEEKVFWVNKPR